MRPAGQMVKVLRQPDFTMAGNGFRITKAGAVMWRGRLLVLWPGFETDFASTPRIIRPLIDNDEPGIRLAAMLHDAAYRSLKCFTDKRLTRRQADQMLYDVAIHRGLPRWKANIVWAAVRLGGWRYWR